MIVKKTDDTFMKQFGKACNEIDRQNANKKVYVEYDVVEYKKKSKSKKTKIFFYKVTYGDGVYAFSEEFIGKDAILHDICNTLVCPVDQVYEAFRKLADKLQSPELLKHFPR